jgi:hypothetical protein
MIKSKIALKVALMLLVMCISFVPAAFAEETSTPGTMTNGNHENHATPATLDDINTHWIDIGTLNFLAPHNRTKEEPSYLTAMTKRPKF